MHLGLVLQMAVDGFGDRTALTAGGESITYAELAARARAASAAFRERSVPAVAYVGPSSIAFPVALFGAAGAGVPFVPLSYRLGPTQLAAQLAAHPGALVVHEADAPPSAGGGPRVRRQDFMATLEGTVVGEAADQDPDAVALLLYTSGTTSEPRAAVLRHRHLVSYLFGTYEFAGAGQGEAALVSVPPYHVAGVANLLSNIYAGRRVVYLERFEPALWLQTVRAEQITQAMVVPTMLARLVEHLQGAADAATPSLATLSYGGSRLPLPVLRRALELFPSTGFVNAYGLTETSSTIALLGPEDHRAALASDDPFVRERIRSAGRLLPGITLEVRSDRGETLPPGGRVLLYLRGDQVSGEYAGVDRPVDGGWFPTRDRGWIDRDGYLFVEGRADDTIIRGGENIAPAEIEDVLLSHGAVVDAVVVGLPDGEWGQRLVAVVVAGEGRRVEPAELRELVRARLRSSRTPERVEVWEALPRTDTGKILRRAVVARLGAGTGAEVA